MFGKQKNSEDEIKLSFRQKQAKRKTKRIMWISWFSHSVVSYSLWLHGLQSARLPCPSPIPRAVQTHVHQVSDAIQPSHPLSSPSPPTFNLSQYHGIFPMSQFFTSGSQSIRVSAAASVLPMNIQDWFPLGWLSLISLQSRGLSRVFSHTIVQKHQSSALS